MKRPKFGIAREDPIFELEAIDYITASSVVCVGSGGCIPLSLKYLRPNLTVTAFDFNPNQIELIHQKNSCLDLAAGPERVCRLRQLNQSGEFEGLFRLFRQTLLEFISVRKNWILF